MEHPEPAGGPEQVPALIQKSVLERRAAVMFSGDTGAVVASGDGLAASSATNALAKHAVDVVDTLQPQLFDRYAEHRPCGLLCRRGAVGMLIADMLGLPLVPWILAEPIGKQAYKLHAAVEKEIKKAKVAAKPKLSRLVYQQYTV